MFFRIISIVIFLLTPTITIAADQNIIWGNPSLQIHLKRFSTINLPNTTNLSKSQFLNLHANTSNQLAILKASFDSKQQAHIRYQQKYQGIPVFGYQVIYFPAKNRTTGIVVNDIEKDVPSIKAKYSSSQIVNFLKTTRYKHQMLRILRSQLIIYANSEQPKSTAKLAYYVTFFMQTPKGTINPNYIIDANTKAVLQYWDGIEHATIGQGPGGNMKNTAWLPGGRDAIFQYGDAQGAGIEQLGKLDVTQNGNTCTMGNSYIQVVNMDNVDFSSVNFPITRSQESSHPVFTYTCTAGNSYENTNDGTTCSGAACAPVNGGESPINDSFYFGDETMDMWINTYNIANPVGSNLPVTIYTHLANEDNAAAIPENSDGSDNNQQLIIGNGDTDSYPLTQGTIGHELAHLFTDVNSNLTYANQSGGMDEAFSDMSDMAMKAYVDSLYNWFDYNWKIGIGETKTAAATRYMNDPPLDGNSIDNQSNYTAGMDVHYSSGIFNKAFYELSTTTGWTLQKAYLDMANANIKYWVPSSTFDFGACGVIQQAIDAGEDRNAVIAAFSGVGVTCKVGLNQMT